MSFYPGDAAGGINFGYPLDPDITSGVGVPYRFNFNDLIGSAGEIASYSVSAESGLTVASDAKGNETADASVAGGYTFTAAASSADTVEVLVYCTAGTARVGNRYAITVTATDAAGVQWPLTGYILVADR